MNIDGIPPTAKRVQIKSHNLLLGSALKTRLINVFFRSVITFQFMSDLFDFWCFPVNDEVKSEVNTPINFSLVKIFFVRKWGENNFSFFVTEHICYCCEDRSITSSTSDKLILLIFVYTCSVCSYICLQFKNF